MSQRDALDRIAAALEELVAIERARDEFVRDAVTPPAQPARPRARKRERPKRVAPAEVHELIARKNARYSGPGR